MYQQDRPPSEDTCQLPDHDTYYSISSPLHSLTQETAQLAVQLLPCLMECWLTLPLCIEATNLPSTYPQRANTSWLVTVASCHAPSTQALLLLISNYIFECYPQRQFWGGDVWQKQPWHLVLQEATPHTLAADQAGEPTHPVHLDLCLGVLVLLLLCSNPLLIGAGPGGSQLFPPLLSVPQADSVQVGAGLLLLIASCM